MILFIYAFVYIRYNYLKKKNNPSLLPPFFLLPKKKKKKEYFRYETVIKNNFDFLYGIFIFTSSKIDEINKFLIFFFFSAKIGILLYYGDILNEFYYFLRLMKIVNWLFQKRARFRIRGSFETSLHDCGVFSGDDDECSWFRESEGKIIMCLCTLAVGMLYFSIFVLPPLRSHS